MVGKITYGKVELERNHISLVLCYKCFFIIAVNRRLILPYSCLHFKINCKLQKIYNIFPFNFYEQQHSTRAQFKCKRWIIKISLLKISHVPQKASIYQIYLGTFFIYMGTILDTVYNVLNINLFHQI